MKRKLGKLIVAAVLAGLATAVFVGSVGADSSAFTFTMNNRYVNGKANHKLHTLEAGELTISGQIWLHEKRRGAATTALPIQIDVVKDTFMARDVVCAVTVVPDRTISAKTAYSKSCGRIEGGTYFIRATKVGAENPDGEGWHNTSAGTLTTQ
jgi:hypothetical protein